MCVKEAVSEHRQSIAVPLHVRIEIEPTQSELIIRVRDDGSGIVGQVTNFRGNGLRGMRERLKNL